MDLRLVLGGIAAAFGVIVLFRFRPRFGGSASASTARLRDALSRARAPGASDSDRAFALAEAGEICAKRGRAGSAVTHFAEASRLAGGDAAIVGRAAAALARRPPSLEALYWRLLAEREWRGSESQKATLERLAVLYEARKKPLHAKAIRNALALF